MKKKILVLLLFVIIGFIGFKNYKSHNKLNPNELTLFGNVEIRQVDLGFRVEGKIAEMLVEEGDAVEKGQLLGYLEDANYKSTYQKILPT